MSRRQVLLWYIWSFDILQLSTTRLKNKSILFLNLRTNLLSFWCIHVPMHKGRRYRSFMKLKLYKKSIEWVFYNQFKVGWTRDLERIVSSTHSAVFEYFIGCTSKDKLRQRHQRHMTMLKHLVAATHRSERCAFHRLRSLPSTPMTAKQDKGMRKRNCLSTIAKMVEMQQYKDNGEERNCSNLIKVARRSRGTPKTKREDGAIARFEKKRHSRNCCRTFEGNLRFAMKPNSKDKRCESKGHKLNTKETKTR